MEDITDAKKPWEKPELVVYGNIEKITGKQRKTFGGADGVILVLPNGEVGLASI